MKSKEGNYTGKSISDGTIGGKVHRETGNIEDLVKRKRIRGMSSTMALDRTRPTVSNGNKEVRCGRVI